MPVRFCFIFRRSNRLKIAFVFAKPKEKGPFNSFLDLFSPKGLYKVLEHKVLNILRLNHENS